jgi:prevent-host-death family protein
MARTTGGRHYLHVENVWPHEVKQVVEHVEGTSEVVDITREGQPVAVVVSITYYRWLRSKVDALIAEGKI